MSNPPPSPEQMAAKAKHPAGSKFVPKVAVLERLATVLDEHRWLYGMPSPDAPNRMERWDVRSVLDYACLTYRKDNQPTYANFYLMRNTVMQCLLDMAELANYGEWRYWETEKDRTHADIMRIVRRTLAAERAREKASKQ